MVNKSYSEASIAYALLDILKKYNKNADLMESMKIISENIHTIVDEDESISWLELAQIFDQQWGSLTSENPSVAPMDIEGIDDINCQADSIYNRANSKK